MSEQTTNETTADQTAATDATTGTPPKQEEQAKVVFTPEQQAEINKLIGAARREGKQSAAEDAAEAKRKADEDAERERQIKAGEFDQVRASLETERDTAVSERDDYRTRFETVIAAIKPAVDEQWSALPVEVTELFDGADDDVLAKQTHIARHKKLIDRLTDQQGEKRQAAGFGRTPTPNGTKDDKFKPVAPVRF